METIKVRPEDIERAACDSVKARCECDQDYGHEGNHTCPCGGSWDADGAVVTLPQRILYWTEETDQITTTIKRHTFGTLKGGLVIDWKSVAHHQRYRRQLAEQHEIRLKQHIYRLREALALIVGAFTNGVYCGSCGEPVDDCGCVIENGRKALR